LLLALCVAPLRAGWSFDTGLAPEPAAALLAADGMQAAPADSWLRLREMGESAVIGERGREEPLVAGRQPSVSREERRKALSDLRAHGYRLMALIQWDDASWAGGVRDRKTIRQLPIDLREAFARCRSLAFTYGDLIDYWEIGNEPDIGYIEENPETYAAFLKACYLGVKRGMEARGKNPMLGAKAKLQIPNAKHQTSNPKFQGIRTNGGSRKSEGRGRRAKS